MVGPLLAALLVSATAGGERAFIVDPGQALVTVDAAAFSVFSHGLAGEVAELGNGTARMELRLPFQTMTTGNPRQDARVSRAGEAVFQGVAQTGAAPWRFTGTLTFHGISRPVEVSLAVVKIGSVIFG